MKQNRESKNRLNKGTEESNRGKESLFNKLCWKNGMSQPLTHSIHRNEFEIEYRHKHKRIIKLHKENIGENMTWESKIIS